MDLIFYGNFWIAAAALALVLQTQFVLLGYLAWTPLSGLALFATLFLYAIHRIVGMSKVKAFEDQGRYKVIRTFRTHIIFYAILSLIGSIYYFFRLSWLVQAMIVVPAIISLGYVVPFLAQRKRLRDLNFVKIFLVAITWAWVTVLLPAVEYHLYLHIPSFLIFLERGMFVFAITIPFDIRDLTIDQHNAVKTLPAYLGINNSKKLAIACLAIMLVLVYLNYCLTVYTTWQVAGFILSALISAWLIMQSDRMMHDYYFTGLMDGMMILQFLLIVFLS